MEYWKQAHKPWLAAVVLIAAAAPLAQAHATEQTDLITCFKSALHESEGGIGDDIGRWELVDYEKAKKEGRSLDARPTIAVPTESPDGLHEGVYLYTEENVYLYYIADSERYTYDGIRAYRIWPFLLDLPDRDPFMCRYEAVAHKDARRTVRECKMFYPEDKAGKKITKCTGGKLGEHHCGTAMKLNPRTAKPEALGALKAAVYDRLNRAVAAYARQVEKYKSDLAAYKLAQVDPKSRDGWQSVMIFGRNYLGWKYGPPSPPSDLAVRRALKGCQQTQLFDEEGAYRSHVKDAMRGLERACDRLNDKIMCGP